VHFVGINLAKNSVRNPISSSIMMKELTKDFQFLLHFQRHSNNNVEVLLKKCLIYITGFISNVNYINTMK